MEASLRMRLDHGLPLTPELLGFIKDEDGKLVMNPETANIPRLMFSMYIYYYEAKSMRDMVQQTREEWQTRIDGQLCSTGEKLNVTSYEELRAFIQQELGELFEEVQPE